MIRLFVPILLVGVALGLFFGYIDPTYTKIKTLQAEEARFDQALEQSRELQSVRDSLLSRYNTFPTGELRRLEKMLPDNVDNVRLILDIDSMAARYNMRTRNVTISGANGEENEVIGGNQGAVGSVILSFSVAAEYDNFLRFLRDLEQSLRIVDLVGLSFDSSEGDAYTFNVSLKTYWLK